MRLWRILAVAAVVEAAVIAALAAVGGAVGVASDWLDLFNVLAPVWLALGMVSVLAAPLVPGPGRSRAMVVALGLVAVVAAGSRVAPEVLSLRPSAAAQAGTAPLKLLTMNTWKENARPEATAAAILAAHADVVTLQERGGLRGGMKTLTAHYPYYSRCRGRAGQNIILSRLPILDQGCVGEEGPRRGPRDVELAWLKLAGRDGRPFIVATTHIGWPIPPGVQPQQSEALADALKAIEDPTLIFAGDFNTAPWTYAMMRQDRRLAPLTRRTRALPTWPAEIPRLGIRWAIPFLPIDHVYAGPAWRTMEVRRIQSAGSDHFGVMAVLARR